MKWFSAARGYGYVKPDDGTPEVLVQISAVREAGLPDLRPGQKIAYDLQYNRGMRTAINLKPA